VIRPLASRCRLLATRGRREWAPRDRGSVLLLFPVAVLVVVVLAAITVDSAIVFLGQREVANTVAAAANDAATIGVSNGTFYRAGAVELDPATAEQMATERVRVGLDGDRFRDLRVDVTVIGGAEGCPPSVRVHASATVAHVFAPAVPGAPRRSTVEATSVAAPAQSDAGNCTI
jgi:Flp pilus assembly protein TadG